MHQRAAGQELATLGDDLVLLSIRPRDGRLMTGRRLGYGLTAAELIRLADLGHVTITDGFVVAGAPAATGDVQLDEALATLAALRPPPTLAAWIALPRRGICGAYLDRLVAEGVLRMEPAGLLGGHRYRIVSRDRLNEACARIRAAASCPDRAAGLPQATLGGLAVAVGLDSLVYPGWSWQAERTRLAALTGELADDLSGAVREAALAAVHAAADAGIEPAR